MDIIEIRHYLHQHPELSGQETNTMQTIADFLKPLKPDILETHVAGCNGLTAVFYGENRNKSVAFRADIDALPIEEDADLQYKSYNKGVAHKCGHDGHTAILLDFARKIAFKSRPFNIILLFQPEEETGYGAKKMLQSETLRRLKPDAIFGLHNIPGAPLGDIVIKYDTFAAASTGFIIKLHGRQAHAAYPETGINPGMAVAEIIAETQKIHSEATVFRQTTLIYTRIGEIAFGTSAGDAEIMLTLRSFTNAGMKELIKTVENIAAEKAKKYNLRVGFDFKDSFNALENNDRYVDIIKSSAEKLNYGVDIITEPFRWSEDLSLIHI